MRFSLTTSFLNVKRNPNDSYLRNIFWYLLVHEGFYYNDVHHWTILNHLRRQESQACSTYSWNRATLKEKVRSKGEVADSIAGLVVPGLKQQCVFGGVQYQPRTPCLQPCWKRQSHRSFHPHAQPGKARPKYIRDKSLMPVRSIPPIRLSGTSITSNENHSASMMPRSLLR